ncbi:unnamed protein product [Lepidochelys olivacea]
METAALLWFLRRYSRKAPAKECMKSCENGDLLLPAAVTPPWPGAPQYFILLL